MSMFLRPALPYLFFAALVGLAFTHGYMYRKGVTVGAATAISKVNKATQAQQKSQAAAVEKILAQHANEVAQYETIITELRGASDAAWSACVMPDAAYRVLHDAYRRYAAEQP